MPYQSPDHAIPEAFHELAGRLAPAFAWAALALVGGGLATALLLATNPPGHGDTFRIAAIHYPAAWASLGIYLAMGVLSAVTLRHHNRLTSMLAAALAPTGLLFTLLALWTEALWRKPLRGVWWIWDAEAVSQLMLLFLMGGFVALRAMLDDPRRADRAAALLAVMGVANLPVLYFSLHWWDLLHHEASLAAVPPMPGLLLAAAVLVGAGFAAYAIHAALKRARCLIAERQALARDLRRLLESEA